MNSQDINKMKETYLEVVSEAKFDAKAIKQAIGIASDKRYAGGNYSGAVKTIEKLAKGLSQHPQVAAVLKRQNEDIDPELLKKAAVGKKKSDDEEESGKKAVPAGKDVDVEKDEDEGEEKDSGEESEDKPKKKKKKEKQKCITITLTSRNKRKTITNVAGFEHFSSTFQDGNLKEVAKTLGKKFACGCSVTKGATNQDEIDLQGDYGEQIKEILVQKWKMEEELVVVVDKSKK